MATNLINQYYRELEGVKRAGHTRNETTIRTPFQHLLLEYCRTKDLQFLTEVGLKTPLGTTVYPDGVARDTLGVLDWGYWESKDTKDSLEDEILKKFANGYPRFNILFEDSQTVVLIQGDVRREAKIADPVAFDEILKAFINYERPEIQEFRTALTAFRAEVPQLSQALRDLMLIQQMGNPEFVKARDGFLTLCRDAINPAVSPDDVREMIVQHILTEDLFVSIFDNPDFHRENTIARSLESVLATFFTGKDKRNFLSSIKHYYAKIKATVSQLPDLGEKQRILKVVYEEFYKAYNPKGADRLGIVYTPNEIVRFMIHSVEQLLEKHFNKTLSDDGVNILDPATGTGTYICDLLQHIIPTKRKYKYQNEIFCNEVSILPYYIANLNIEFTYNVLAGEYEPFENICFVDTLDNIDGLVTHKGRSKAGGLFGSVTAENAERIKRQNEQKISVIIGNPPYNAAQSSENENNANRKYPEIDKRIKETYVKHSKTQNLIKVYDMFARFYRWATDRLTDKGVIAFITNRSFIDSRTFDGFRKGIETDFSECYIVDTRSDVRANPKIAGTTHNVFGIQTGVAVMFLVRKPKPTDTPQPCKIFYVTLQDEQKKEEKLDWFAQQSDFEKVDFARLYPDENHNWLNLTDNDWETLMPLAAPETRKAKEGETVPCVFQLYSLGVNTNRDEWAYDLDKDCLAAKIQHTISVFNAEVDKHSGQNYPDKLENHLDYSIKWAREFRRDLERGLKYKFDETKIVESLYRPFFKEYLYFDRSINEMRYQMPNIFPIGKANLIISVNGHNNVYWDPIATKYLINLNALYGGTQSLPLYRYTPAGERIDNITDWALDQFRTRYPVALASAGVAPTPAEASATITKLDIFHYVYAVLHDPAYRTKYELNLKRDFPRIPFYDDFWQWAQAGAELMALHVDFETVEPYPLERREKENSKFYPTTAEEARDNMSVKTPAVKLRADKEAGLIVIDDQTTLEGIPAEAWNYKLGNRSALEWILDQYKESKIKDPTIAQKTLEGEFKAYRFADYKETVIDLLCRVCTVSVETMRIVGAF